MFGCAEAPAPHAKTQSSVEIRMRPDLFVYAIIIGLLPFLLGIVAGEVAPHSDAAQLPWFTMVTLPLAVIVGALLALFM